MRNDFGKQKDSKRLLWQSREYLVCVTRFCLESFSKDFSSYQHAQQSIATAVAQYADGLAAAMRRLKGETEALKALQSGPLEMFLKRYEHLSKEQNNELTRDLTTLVKALTEKKFGSIEELKSLQLRLA